MSHLGVLLFLCFFGLPLLAAIDTPFGVNFSQNPSSVEWKKIDTEHFEIIFPAEVEEEAQRVAFLLERAYPFVTRSLETLPPKIPLVLQNQSVVSNGFVTLAPRRSEWYLTPAVEPILSNTEWLKTLAIHEFRHVVQFQKTRRGFNKFLEIILGEIGQAIGLGLTLPPWYLEGDAVGIETLLTDGGRGRLPLFDRDLRTLLLSGKEFDYDKAHLRSYEDYVPNHYVYGYFLTTYLRSKYGDLFLSKLANRSAEMSWNPLTFYNSTDVLTQRSFEDFYQSTMAELIKDWRDRYEQLSPSPLVVKNLGKRFGWTNYYYPQVTSDGKILAVKYGQSYIDHFVLLDGKEEKSVLYPGPLNTEYPIKLRQDKFAYIELEVDPRWGYRDFSRLKVYDLKKDEQVLDVRQTKLRLAVISHDADKVMAVSWDSRQGQEVVVLDLKGKVLKRLPFPKKEIITSLDWLNNHEAVLVIKDCEDLKSIIKFSLETGERTVLLEKHSTNIGFVTAEQGKILFESPESGIDNIFLLEGAKARQITSSRFGAYAPTLKGQKLIYNDYTVDGMNVVEKEGVFDSEHPSSGSFLHYYESIGKFEGKEGLAAKLAEKESYAVADYSQVRNAINLHSWLLLAPPFSRSIIVAGFSRDVLNKFTLSAGAEHDLNERTTQGFVSLAWSHLFPVFDLSATYGNRRQDVRLSGRDVENKWEEGTAELGLQVPWKKIFGRMNQVFTLRAFAKIIKVTNKVSSDETEISDGALFSPGGEFGYSLMSRMASRDLLPRYGFSLDGSAEEGRDFTGDDQRGAIATLDSKLFLPGLWYHHSFYHQFAYERQRDDFYQYSSLVLYPRGTKSVFLRELKKYSGNYALPLFYPDWHWSRYFYLKRVYANLFYDIIDGNYGTTSYTAGSTGWELLFDAHFVRLFIPITFGVRGSYVLHGDEKDRNYEIFLASTLGEF